MNPLSPYRPFPMVPSLSPHHRTHYVLDKPRPVARISERKIFPVTVSLLRLRGWIRSPGQTEGLLSLRTLTKAYLMHILTFSHTPTAVYPSSSTASFIME